MSLWKKILGISKEDVPTTSPHPFPGPMTTPVPQSLQNPIWTPEDEEQLSKLMIEHAQQIKQAKLAEFMKLNASVREHIIDSIQFYESIKKINCSGVASSFALKDLLAKKDIYYSYLNKYISHRGFNPQAHDNYANGSVFKIHATQYSSIELENSFSGLTLEDLIKAHTDATVDEEVLGNKP